jgi:RNA polymerase subunit RPABC4/transcription elongation factor Spt4
MHPPLGALPGDSTASPGVRPLVSATHGDLIVNASNSPYVLSPATTGVTTYYEEGNITVLPGGILDVRNLTLSFLEFITDSGNAGQRASHLYNFTVEGLAVFNDSVLTTTTSVLNAYVKLTVNVTDGGTLVADTSTFAFPGFVDVSGGTSRFFANSSYILPNENVPALKENQSLLHDTSFSPALSVNDGARVTLLQSSWLDYYADNVSQVGQAGANLTNLTVPAVHHFLNLTNYTWGQLVMPTPLPSSEALALGYPSIGSGSILFRYQDPGAASVVGSASHITFLGTNYAFTSPIVFPSTPANVTLSYLLPLPASFLAAVNQKGILSLLQSTGQFGTAPSLSLAMINASGLLEPIALHMLLVPNYPFNMLVNNGSTVTAADSTLDLNWNALPGTPVDQGVIPPEPWNSNKMMLSGNSSAYFANVSLPTSFETVFDNQSVVVPTDALSHAYIFRWGSIQALSGAFGPIPNVHVVAFSAYNASDSNNATVGRLNNLSSSDPDLDQYLVGWVNDHHVSYGVTDAQGNALFLLASSVVTSASLPTGSFVGSYHFGTVLPGGGPNSTVWQYGSLTPYPLGMSPSSTDQLPIAQYPNYRAELQIGGITVSVNNVTVANDTIAIGQYLTLTVPISNVGTAALVNFTANFVFDQPKPFPPLQLSPQLKFHQLDAGAKQMVNFSWLVNESVIGLGGEKNVTFLVNASWNGGAPPIGGITTAAVPVHVLPAYIALTYAPPTGPLTIGQTYLGFGKVAFAGKGLAFVNVTFTGPGGSFEVASDVFASGTIPGQSILAAQGLQSGGTYTVTVTAEYNDRTVSISPGVIHIAGTPPAPPSFWDTPVFGPITWLYLIIIIAAVLAALAAFLLLTGRLSRGKLVECGECGSLIPAAATVCPKCGAEFEADLVRCSRCSSTVPANSAVCPECAAQLLGKPTDEAHDPERQGYSDFVERYRAESKKELGDNYGEGAFWDWWKRQPTYVSFNQWKLQQAASSRAGMTAPIVSTPEAAPSTPPTPPRRPPPGGAGPGAAPPPAARASVPPPKGSAAATTTAPAAPPTRRPAPAAPSTAAPPSPPEESGSAEAAAGMRACGNCGKEIPSDFLVCPFCGAVTR